MKRITLLFVRAGIDRTGPPGWSVRSRAFGTVNVLRRDRAAAPVGDQTRRRRRAAAATGRARAGRRWRRCAQHWSTNWSPWPPTAPASRRALGLSAAQDAEIDRNAALRAAPRPCRRSSATPGCCTTRSTSTRCAAPRRPVPAPGSPSARRCSDCCAPTTRYPPTGCRRRRSCPADRRWPAGGDPCWSRCWPNCPPPSSVVDLRSGSVRRARQTAVQRSASTSWPNTPTAGAPSSPTSTRRTRAGWPAFWQRRRSEPDDAAAVATVARRAGMRVERSGNELTIVGQPRDRCQDDRVSNRWQRIRGTPRRRLRRALAIAGRLRAEHSRRGRSGRSRCCGIRRHLGARCRLRHRPGGDRTGPPRVLRGRRRRRRADAGRGPVQSARTDLGRGRSRRSTGRQPSRDRSTSCCWPAT